MRFRKCPASSSSTCCNGGRAWTSKSLSVSFFFLFFPLLEYKKEKRKENLANRFWGEKKRKEKKREKWREKQKKRSPTIALFR